MKTPKPRKQKKENFIQKAMRLHKEKEEKRVREQLDFLYNKTLDYYKTVIPIKRIRGVDIPAFMYERQRNEDAKKIAMEELLFRVADRKVLNRLCKRNFITKQQKVRQNSEGSNGAKK